MLNLIPGQRNAVSGMPNYKYKRFEGAVKRYLDEVREQEEEEAR